MHEAQLGIIGMGVMGRNLALNMREKGFSIAVYNRTGSVTKQFLEHNVSTANILGAYTIEEFINALTHPRKILLLITAGDAIEKVTKQLHPYLQSGDILLDTGNSHYRDTEARQQQFAQDGIHYLGMGISGGAAGARHGPTFMPGGEQDTWKEVEQFFTAVAATAEDGKSCAAYIGNRGAGHYVKMVHNCMAFTLLQLLAEAYTLLHGGLGMPHEAILPIFEGWSREKLAGLIMETAVQSLALVDPDTGNPLADMIQDVTVQDHTGAWTLQDAAALDEPVPSLHAAITARFLSGKKDERETASHLLTGAVTPFDGVPSSFVSALRDAVFGSMIVIYAQGFSLLRSASTVYNYDLNFPEISQIWREGCVIHSRLMYDIHDIFVQDPDIANLLLASPFRSLTADPEFQAHWRSIVMHSVLMGLSVPVLTQSLSYFDGYRTDSSSANMLMLWRNIITGLPFQRIDKAGDYHIPEG